MQLLDTASVLPQGLALGVRAKAPLAAMLLISSVAVPVLVTVTLLPLLVAPTASLLNVRDGGSMVTAGAELFVTVSCTVVVLVKEPDTPLMVTVEVPTVAVALAVKVSELVVLAGFGEKFAVTPLGRVEVLRVTLPLNPFSGVIETVVEALLP